jgi:hypothetical protein
MFTVFCVVLALVALAACYRKVGGSRKSRSAAGDPLSRVLKPDELRELDAHLDAIAQEELLRLDATLMRYIAGAVGHVVVVSSYSHGIALALSDGRRMTLGGVSGVTRRRLLHRAAQDKLRPARIEREEFSYRLLLRSEAGAEIEFHTRSVALAP